MTIKTQEKIEIKEFQNAEHKRNSVPKTYKLYIDGKFPRTESGRFYTYKSEHFDFSANICLSSRKDLRDAVTAARNAQHKWASATAYNRGQILYRIAEMLEGRRAQFVDELQIQGATLAEAKAEVDLSIDRLVYYAGWSDKYQQVFSQVNPVASSHFNFTVYEPTGVVTVICPEATSLIGLISTLAPAIVSGNTVVALASYHKPLCAITFSEVLATSDLPSGVVNILTGTRSELVSHMSSHMDVNATVYCGQDLTEKKQIEENSALNIKRCRVYEEIDWFNDKCQNPYRILDLMEAKTTWHPIGR